MPIETKPLIHGTHLRPGYVENSNDFLIFTRRGISIDNYPAVRNYLAEFHPRLEPKPPDWNDGSKWPGRKGGSYQWYELQDTVEYGKSFEQPKIVWSDISKLSRFSMDTTGRYMGKCSALGQERYEEQTKARHRLRQTFGEASDKPLNQKATAWWEHALNPLDEALKKSFKLPGNPMKTPRIADEWEPYPDEKRADQTRLTRVLQDAEAEINECVYRLFDLTREEIALLQKEVEHGAENTPK